MWAWGRNEAPRGLEIIAGRDEEVAAWLLERLPDMLNLGAGYSAIGVARDGALTGGALYTNYRPCLGGGNIEVSCAGHGWLSRRVIGILLGYPFDQLGCHRLTSFVRKKNKPSRRLLEGLGFKLEGVHPDGFGPRTGDSLSYGLLKRDNRWAIKE